MHLEILNKDQQHLLPFLAKFKREYYMVGGTAIALHIGHRLSIDFDLFKTGSIKPKSIFSKFDAAKEQFSVYKLNTKKSAITAKNTGIKTCTHSFEVNAPSTNTALKADNSESKRWFMIVDLL